MTHKAIRYSIHASQRMQQRGVRRGDVRRAIAKGTVTRAADAAGMHAAQILFGRESLVVLYKESATGIYVVTLYFENR